MNRESLDPEISLFLEKEQEQSEKLELPSVEDFPAKIREVAEEIATVSGTWNPVEIYTADSSSIASEKQKFFSAFEQGETYNPHFTYGYAQELATTMAADNSKDKLETLK